MQISLKCCTCGATKDIVVTQQPSFGFEFYKIVQESGWYPVLDMNYGRTLCFCDEGCMKKQLTKRGHLRKRLIRCEKEQRAE